jgi:hypothetical protein
MGIFGQPTGDQGRIAFFIVLLGLVLTRIVIAVAVQKRSIGHNWLVIAF